MLEAVLAGVFGLLIGSFLNVCIYRLPRDLSVIAPRSFCPECEEPIAWYDNIPIVSYVILRARCRKCSWRIPLRYPLVELATGGLFFFAVYLNGLSPLAVKQCVFAALMVELAVSDLESWILPDEFTLGGTVLGLAFAFWVPIEPGIVTILLGGSWGERGASVAESMVGAVLSAAALSFVAWLYEKVRGREGMGFGDVKLIALIGAFLGLHNTLLALIIGSVAGSIVGLAWALVRKKSIATTEMPYGTFLCAGALVVAYLRPYAS